MVWACSSEFLLVGNDQVSEDGTSLHVAVVAVVVVELERQAGPVLGMLSGDLANMSVCL